MNAKELAILFHDTYERLAPSFGYETRTETRKFDPTTPNGLLMLSVCNEVICVINSVLESGGSLVPRGVSKI
jgi:hypothetical protein